jgi:hypothetical protein
MKNDIATGIAIAAAIALAWLVFMLGGAPKAAGAFDGFARCLAQKGFTMYGAYWCPHCQNEKKAFGDSFRYVDYVECTEEPNRCLASGIKGYPTWITDDGRRFEGEQGIAKLSEASGCSLENQN